MWANAQRDGRSAEHRWRPLFNAAKFSWRPLLDARNQLKFAGVPKWSNRSQPLVGRSSPYYEDTWRTYWCLTIFFPIVDRCLSCEDIARQNCAMVPSWRFWRLFCVLYFQRATCSTFQTRILNSHWGHTMCGSMADIQSRTAEIRRGNKKEEERRKKRMKYNGLPYYIGRPKLVGRSSPYYGKMWRRYCCLIIFSDCRYML